MTGSTFKHRRQILRRCTESDTHANTFSDPNRDSYADGNCNADGYATHDCTATPRRGLNPRRGRARRRYLDPRGPKVKCNYENEQQN